jgi:hypothetical protein
MRQSDIIRLIAPVIGRFGLFLGAGASRSAGLPTATDILWDLKRQFYNAEENQVVSEHDVQNPALREKIQSYMVSRGFPDATDPGEYTKYFELIFGEDRERQRQYIHRILSDRDVSLALGQRVVGALIAAGILHIAFTTNFDNVVERAAAEVGGIDLAAFHLEGTRAALAALSNDEFPIYCKLHGDFRYDSIRNLLEDLAAQNEELGRCFQAAANRFGFIVLGYSGRDESVMRLMHETLKTTNPFPHGLYWATLVNRPPLQAVTDLIEAARARGVTAEIVEIETFDSLMARLWRQIPSLPPALDGKVLKAARRVVDIPLPAAGTRRPVLRTNALPITRLPTKCHALHFGKPLEWADVKEAENRSSGTILATKEQDVLAWGMRGAIAAAFGGALTETKEYDLGAKLLALDDNLFLKSLLERAIGYALKKDKPLLFRPSTGFITLIADAQQKNDGIFQPLYGEVGTIAGTVAGLMSTPSEKHPEAEQVRWAESVEISFESKGDRSWILLQPNVWIWPRNARKDATEFLQKRRGGRLNAKADGILSAWIKILFPTTERATDVEISSFGGGDAIENPLFVINTRTAYSFLAGA